MSRRPGRKTADVENRRQVQFSNDEIDPVDLDYGEEQPATRRLKDNNNILKYSEIEDDRGNVTQMHVVP